jgi:hypothetical protein
MKPVDRQKMCPNCDGRIPYEATQCPYCFTTQQADNHTKSFTSADPLTALYNPTYTAQKPAESSEFKTVTKPASASPEIPLSEEKESEGKNSFWSILLCSIGSNLLCLGLLQFFFAEHGVLRLEMNASYWFLMLVIGTPMMYFGFKKLSSIDKS